MIRTLSLLPLLAPGCIIYEEDWDHGECHRCGPDGSDGGGTVVVPGDDDDGGAQTPGTTEPEPEAPLVTADLELTETSAYPGDSLLSSLVVVSGNIDLGAVVSVGFERDVEVLDQLDRPGEIVLLLSVADDAQPGDVDVFVETREGAGFILAKPFTVLEAAPSCGTSGGGTNPNGNGGDSADTGFP